MLPSGNNLSALFRTLAPEEADAPALAKAASPGVGQEWPLFQVVTPTRPEPTPPLTPQERKRWGAQSSVRIEPVKPVVSMAGLSSKLAKSLNQISESMVDEAAQLTDPVSVPAEQPLSKPTQRTSIPVPSPKVGVSLFSKPSPVAESAVQNETGPETSLFKKPLAQPMGAAVPALDNAKTDDSLNAIFSRLSVSESVTIKPVEKRSTLSTRLGKR